MNYFKEKNYKISVIIPALNEERNISKTIENVVESFSRLKIPGEIVVVNDGSTDKTDLIVKKLMKKYYFINMLSHNEPNGLGASYWDGVKVSKGEIITWVPGDGENDAYEILRYMPLMENVDIVIPFVYNKKVRTWKRRVLSKFYKGIINLSFGLLLNYMNGTVMIRRCALRNTTLKNSGFFFQTELLIKSIKKGYLYAEVPSALRKRAEGRTKALTFKSLLKVVSGYISTMFAIYISNKEDKSVAQDSVTALRQS